MGGQVRGDGPGGDDAADEIPGTHHLPAAHSHKLHALGDADAGSDAIRRSMGGGELRGG